MEIGNNGIPLDIFICQFVNLDFEIIEITVVAVQTGFQPTIQPVE